MTRYPTLAVPLEMTVAQDAHFRERAASWDRRYQERPSFQERLRVVSGVIEAALADAPGGRVLDFGGGTGVFSAVASQWASFIVCVDRSAEMLAAAPSGSDCRCGIHRVVGDERCLAAGRHPFDVVLAIAVVEYVSDTDGLLRELGRLVRPGGVVLLTVPNPRSVFRSAQRLVGRVLSVRSNRRASGQLADQSYAALRPYGDAVPWRAAAANAELIVDRITSVRLGPSGARSLFRPTLLVSLRRGDTND